VSQWWPPVLSSRPSGSRPKPTTESTTSSATTITTTPTTSTTSYYSSQGYEPEDKEAVTRPTASNVEECENGKYYRDPSNCGIYYLCVHGRKKKYNCPNGLHFNSKSEICDWPSRMTCQDFSSGTLELLVLTTPQFCVYMFRYCSS
jgi:hypothetical protein